MTDLTAGGDLPTAAQMRTLLAASDAAWRARQLRETSRAVVTGNLAAGVCLFGVALSLMHSEWAQSVAPFVLCGLVYAYLAELFLSRRWMRRRQTRYPVTVTDRREEATRAALAQPRRMATIVLANVLVLIVATVGWMVAFDRMSNAAILAALGIGPLIGALFFVGRYAAFRLWEDLLFAGCVALAFAPFFLRADLVLLSFASLPLVAIGTASLHYRWARWVRSVEPTGAENGTAEVQA